MLDLLIMVHSAHEGKNKKREKKNYNKNATKVQKIKNWDSFPKLEILY